MIALSPDDRFTFACSKEVRCFNECCKNLNQFLTPYDILRLKQSLGISSSLFIERYSFPQIGSETGLPIISLKPVSESKCPFVTETGCSVYRDRPSSCRAYPLARILSRSRKTGKTTEQYMLFRESHCLGFNTDQEWKVCEWTEDQELSIYYEMNDLLMEIISLKNRFIPGQLDLKSKRAFQMACYDLDAFREHLFQHDSLAGLPFHKDIKDAAQQEDVHLLKAGIQWLKHAIFDEKIIS